LFNLHERYILKRLIIFAASLASAVAFAQTNTAPVRHTAVIENVSRGPAQTSFCMYDDKRYSEGAIKSLDGVMLICMLRDQVAATLDGEPRELVWESASSFRGKAALGRVNAASAKKAMD